MENDFVARRKLLVLLFATTIKMTAAGKLEFIKNVIRDKIVSIDGVIDNLAQYYPIDDPQAHREYVRALDVTNKTVFKHGGVAATAKMQLDYILDTLSELYNRRDLEGYNKSDAACHYIYRTLKDYLQLNTREVRCWHMHPIGDRWISDDCLTMVHTVMCLPRHVFNDTIKLSLMGIALRPDVASFDSFLMLASSLVNSSAIQQWMHSTQLLVPIGEMDTRRNIRCAPRPVKIADLAQYLARESYSTNATNRETAQAVIDEIPLRTNLHASELHIWVSEFQKYEQSQKKTNQSTTKENTMPTISPDYPTRRRLVNATLKSQLNVTTIVALIGHMAANDIDSLPELVRSVGTFGVLGINDNMLAELQRVYSIARDIESSEHVALLLTTIQNFARVAGGESNPTMASFLKLHHAYLGVSQKALDAFNAACKPLSQRMLGDSAGVSFDTTFPLRTGGPVGLGCAPKKREFNSVKDLKKTLAEHPGVSYSDDLYAALLKAFNVSPAAALQSLLELDVLATELSLSAEQYPKALSHIFSKCPASQLIYLPRTPEGTSAEQVEFVIYWTLLASHLKGYPIPLQPKDLDTVFKFVTSEHYRATLIFII